MMENAYRCKTLHMYNNHAIHQVQYRSTRPLALTMQVLLSVHTCIHAQSIHVYIQCTSVCTCMYSIHVCFIEGYSEGNRGERGKMRGSYPV